ncbi:MXAN_5453 family MXYO-CTERM-anchored protein [Myxococcus vastator]|uniref:MXAN_5453 family MXYO-CTERM-anchored protein n=1 Tax=Myxococcus vastator TaxID=2709664 RepID=UPI0013D0878C|nr:MXAN_5453 family MXYO-CTERM-anchored protein [Myxococcus vastator]
MSVAGRKRSARTCRVSGRTLALSVLTLAAPAWAQVPEYTLELQARTNLLGNASGAYNVAPGNLLAGSLQLPLTDDGQLAFRLAITPEGREAVWWGQEGTGQRIYMLPDLGEDARISDPSLNAQGNLAFAVTGASSASQNGIYRLNVASPDDVRIERIPIGASNWSSLQLNEVEVIGFRAAYGGGGQSYVLQGSGWVSTLVSDNIADSSSPYSFLYSPRLNDQEQIAGVVDLASASAEFFQELRIFNVNAESQLVARTRGLDANSPVYRFASVQPAFNNQGQVAFLGTARDAFERNVTTLWRWDGTELRVIAQDGLGEIRQLEFFPPDMNDSGLVVFRAFDAANLRAVWVSDGQELKRVVSEHDLVTSDLGPARIDQETPSNPVFAGAPSINARSDVALAAGLAPPDNDQEEWGTAVFIARAAFPQTDGGVDGGPGEDPDAGTGTDPDGGADGGPGEDPDAGTGTDPDGGPSEDPDAGTGADPDAGPGEDPDAGTGADPDAGTGTELDAGTEPDAGPGEEPEPDGGPSQERDAGTSPPPPPPDSGCGCQSSSPAALLPWMLVGLMRVVVGRRRKGT